MSGAVIDTIADERAELRRLRHLERGRRKAARIASREWRRKLREATRDARVRFPKCRCDFTGVDSRDKLIAMDGCCDPLFVCPRLDAVRRRMGI